jgi:hypothetical protein
MKKIKKLFKCALWFVKEYANVGIALALFMLIGLQIEQQYRNVRYFENCIKNSNWVEDVKYSEKVEDCTEVRSEGGVTAFNYHKGIISNYWKY